MTSEITSYIKYDPTPHIHFDLDFDYQDVAQAEADMSPVELAFYRKYKDSHVISELMMCLSLIARKIEARREDYSNDKRRMEGMLPVSVEGNDNPRSNGTPR